MEESQDPRSPPRGLWWKSFLGAWLGLRAIAAGAAALGVEIPDEVGLPVLAVVWILVWRIWRHRVTRDDRAGVSGVLAATQRTWAAFLAAVVLIGVVVVTLDTDPGLGRTDVSVEAVAVGLIVIGIVSIAGSRVWVPRLDASNRASVVKSYQNRFFARVAWAEAPALLAFGGFLLLGGEAWVYLIGLSASLLGFALAAPTRAAVRRDQEELNALGTTLDLLEVLGGASSDRGTNRERSIGRDP